MRDNVGYRLDAEAHPEAASCPTWRSSSRSLGYATGAAVSSYVLDRKTGIATGFDFYDDQIELHTGGGLGGLQRPGFETLQAALGWFDKKGNGPAFLFVHFYEPHTPYDPPEPFASKYANKYDGEIAAADNLVGQLLDDLRADFLYDKALIVLCGDHGEGLGDHGEAEHGVLLYNEAIHVPLILKMPGYRLAGQRVEKPAGLTDIAPTILRLLGQKPSPEPAGNVAARPACRWARRPGGSIPRPSTRGCTSGGATSPRCRTAKTT